MKRTVKTILITLAALLVLTACGSSAHTSVTDGDTVIFEINDTKVTKNDIYQYGKLKSGVSVITRHLIEMELEKYVELSDEDVEKAKKSLEETKESLGDNFEMLVQAQGYKDEEDYYNTYILSSIKIEKLFKLYVGDNLETIMEENNTRKVRILKASDKALGEAALEELKALEELTGESFKEVATKYSGNDETAGDAKIEHIYTGRETDTYLNTHIKDTKPGLVEELIMVEDGFVLIYVEEIDPETDKDSIIASIEANETIGKAVSNNMYLHYAELGNFKIYDQDLNDLFKQDNPFQNK